MAGGAGGKVSAGVAEGVAELAVASGIRIVTCTAVVSATVVVVGVVPERGHVGAMIGLNGKVVEPHREVPFSVTRKRKCYSEVGVGPGDRPTIKYDFIVIAGAVPLDDHSIHSIEHHFLVVGTVDIDKSRSGLITGVAETVIYAPVAIVGATYIGPPPHDVSAVKGVYRIWLKYYVVK